MEILDVVDPQDNVIGKIERSQSHKTGEIHRAIAIFVFDHDGKLYLQEHLKSNNKYDHSIGGHIDSGEDYDQAAKREAKEELGITDPLEEISTFFSDERFRKGVYVQHMFRLYECHPSPSWKFRPNDEVKKIIPMALNEIVDLMNKEPEQFLAGFLNTMQEYIKYKNLPYKLTNFR